MGPRYTAEPWESKKMGVVPEDHGNFLTPMLDWTTEFHVHEWIS